jgi:hypothetical protein
MQANNLVFQTMMMGRYMPYESMGIWNEKPIILPMP